MNDHRAGCFDDTAQHRIPEILAISRRPRSILPKRLGQSTIPLAVVINELLDILLAREIAQGKMMKYRIVQYDDARPRKRLRINRRMQLVVAEMI